MALDTQPEIHSNSCLDRTSGYRTSGLPYYRCILTPLVDLNVIFELPLDNSQRQLDLHEYLHLHTACIDLTNRFNLFRIKRSL